MPDSNAHDRASAQGKPGTGGAGTSPAGSSVSSVASVASSEARTDERRFRAYTFVVLSLGLVAAFAVSAWLPFKGDVNLWWIGLVLVVAFLLAEQLGINVDV